MFAIRPSTVAAQNAPSAWNEPTAGYPDSSLDADPPGYRKLVEEGLREYDLGNLAEARTLFTRAHALFPNARTHRALGKTEFELRNYEASIAQLGAALTSKVRVLPLDLRRETNDLIARARNFTGRLIVDTRPPATEVVVDGVPSSRAPGEALVLDVGDHVIEARTRGYVPVTKRISLQSGETLTLAVVFARTQPMPVTVTTTQPGAAHAVKSERTRTWRNPWLWTTVGIVLAGAAAGASVWLTRDRDPRTTYDRGTFGVLGKAP
ncbi:MAG: PEGA domain-containing protein [Polyangiales bacterium]